MDIQFIRKNPDAARTNQEKRFSDPKIIDAILDTDNEWRKADFVTSQLKSLKNKKISKKYNEATAATSQDIDIDNIIEILLQDKPIDYATLTKQQLTLIAKALDSRIETQAKNCDTLLHKRNELISTLGNILNPNVHISNDESQNVIIYETPTPKQELKYDHNDLGKLLDCIDVDSGSQIAGNRGYFLTNYGVKLNMALMQFALDFLETRKFKLMSTPHTVNKDLMSQITQLSDYDETLYKLEGTDKYLIATSEQPLTAYFNNKHLDPNNLPIRLGGISSCYRKETGAHGKQTRGIFRVHQFEKVEQFCVTDPTNSADMFQEMITNAQEFYNALGLHYRVISIVSGALNNAASIKYDIEVWFPGSKFYGEVVSCTNCLDYFSKRLNVTNNKTGEYLHMLNCTLCANTRVLCALMETYQTEDGMKVPEVLRKYMGTGFIKFSNNNN
jgi:seryl-tRNA synthetase